MRSRHVTVVCVNITDVMLLTRDPLHLTGLMALNNRDREMSIRLSWRIFSDVG